MNLSKRFTDTNIPEHPEKATLEGKNKFVGFWLFLGGETVLFATLFGTYLGLRHMHGTGPTAKELFQLPTVFLATMILLTSSLTSVYAILAMKQNKIRAMQGWFFITLLLGLAFLGLEIYEFNEYVHEGHTFTKSAFSSSFYTLVGFHGGHVLFGCLWLISLLVRNWSRGLNLYNAPKYYLFALYWHFVDVVWVFIFTVVYLMGKVG
ncbi:cytochrome c oxidase subunit 3 [Fictibacillus sp. Mic-4]|uniref:cytochrome c oxidase subunit 3 n=1 Tax=Fictibacillus sp. Mic-4 TaxID=3132826 RepID=UPI003CFBA836